MKRRGLKPLLGLHEMRRRILKQLLAALRGRAREIEERLEALRNEGERVRAWAQARLEAADGAAEQALALRWRERAHAQAEALRRSLAETLAEAEDAAKRLVRASQELKMLASLEARRRERERSEAERAEQVRSDELAATRAGAPR